MLHNFKLTIDRSPTFHISPRPLGDITGNLKAGVGALVDFLELLNLTYNHRFRSQSPGLRNNFGSRFRTAVLDFKKRPSASLLESESRSQSRGLRTRFRIVFGVRVSDASEAYFSISLRSQRRGLRTRFRIAFGVRVSDASETLFSTSHRSQSRGLRIRFGPFLESESRTLRKPIFQSW